MKITKENLSKYYQEVSTNYTGEDYWVFNVHPRVDFYYKPSIEFGSLVTGYSGMGNKILFEGRVTSIEELKFLVDSVSYYEKPAVI